MIINKKIFYAVIIIIISIFSYFVYKMSEDEYKSPHNIDKFVKVSSVTYIPNGREGALCQMICFDKNGNEYHIIDSDKHFVGDVIKYYEHHDKPFIYLTSIFVLLIMALMLTMVLILILSIFAHNVTSSIIFGDFKLN